MIEVRRQDASEMTRRDFLKLGAGAVAGSAAVGIEGAFLILDFTSADNAVALQAESTNRERLNENYRLFESPIFEIEGKTGYTLVVATGKVPGDQTTNNLKNFGLYLTHSDDPNNLQPLEGVGSWDQRDIYPGSFVVHEESGKGFIVLESNNAKDTSSALYIDFNTGLYTVLNSSVHSKEDLGFAVISHSGQSHFAYVAKANIGGNEGYTINPLVYTQDKGMFFISLAEEIQSMRLVGDNLEVIGENGWDIELLSQKDGNSAPGTGDTLDSLSSNTAPDPNVVVPIQMHKLAGAISLAIPSKPPQQS